MSARARFIEILKSILIVLLMGTMALLFLQTWSTDTEGLPAGLRSVVESVNSVFGVSIDGAPTVEGSRADIYGDAVQLRAIAVARDGYHDGFYPPDDAARELYERIRLTLADCLGSAGGAEPIARRDFLAAAATDGAVLICYTDAQPLALLALSHGVVSGVDNASVRELVLVRGGENLDVYLSDGERFLRAATAVESGRLASLAFGAEGVRSTLSTELGFDADAPIAVYPEGELRRAVAASAPSAVGENAVNGLLAAFGMNTETDYRYVSADGTQFAVEGERTLAVSADGVVTYISGGGEGASLRADATDAAIIEFCRAIAAGGSAELTGDAELSLRSFGRSGSRAEVTFGYTLGGLPVYHGGREACAVFTLEEGVLTAARLTLRRYTLGSETALIMPPESAAVIGGREVAYFDEGDGEMIPSWSE